MRDIIIHGHFYQPPREDPWLELVPRERSAAPDHDWNARITRQCYAPLSHAGARDAGDRIHKVLNCWAWCSFDVGPTLFRWFDRHAPEIAQAIVHADRASIARTGHGNAMATPYHHVILPLLSRRDQLTEVRWGIRDFRRRFNREPEGFWLPEAAVDEVVLAVLADERVRFTVLGPEQVDTVPANGRAARWEGAGGRSLAIFVYSGPASHQVAFGNALDDAAHWEDSLTHWKASDDTSDVVAIATDGETFGHHHKGGDQTLAALIDRLAARSDARLTNFAAALAAAPAHDTVRIHSPSSWSCPHGVARWERECGCRFEVGTSQAWREPLRRGLVTLAHGIDETIARLWPKEAGDFATARDVSGADLTGSRQLPEAARVLLEASQHALAMFTSCAWFFDDLARLEPRIVLRHAARALDLLPEADRARLEPPLIATLAEAESNDRRKGSGADIWERNVIPGRDGPAELAAAVAALRDLAPGSVDDPVMPAHTWELKGDNIVLRHTRSGVTSEWHVEPVTLGIVATRCHVRRADDHRTLVVPIAKYPSPVTDILYQIAAPMVFDAALAPADTELLRSGALAPEDARRRALAGAWRLVARDGFDAAGVVVHSVLDLWNLSDDTLDDGRRAEALQMLQPLPASHSRDALADRFEVALDSAGLA